MIKPIILNFLFLIFIELLFLFLFLCYPFLINYFSGSMMTDFTYLSPEKEDTFGFGTIRFISCWGIIKIILVAVITVLILSKTEFLFKKLFTPIAVFINLGLFSLLCWDNVGFIFQPFGRISILNLSILIISFTIFWSVISFTNFAKFKKV